MMILIESKAGVSLLQAVSSYQSGAIYREIQMPTPRLNAAAFLFPLLLISTMHVAIGAEISRGELLYSTHCIACHTTHVHWRDNRLATDWNSLAKQVKRWEENTNLHWDEGDIYAVSQYLNERYYHFPAGKAEKALSYGKQGPKG